MQYLKKFSNHSSYNTYINGADIMNILSAGNNVSYCSTQKDIHYNNKIVLKPISNAKLFDILYANSSGNKVCSPQVLPISLGYVPIGLCLASPGFFGTGQNARWMSLKYMNCSTPTTGSVSSQTMYFGNYGTNLSLTNINKTYVSGTTSGFMLVDYVDNSSKTNKVPNVLTEDNTWNIAELGTVNVQAITSINGKSATTIILSIATAQSNWQSASTITNNSGANYAPAACCCYRYQTYGTQAGDWYLPACGEISILVDKKTIINSKLASINTVYPTYCMSSLYDNYLITSTEYSKNAIWANAVSTGGFGHPNKNAAHRVVALLEL